MKNEKNFNYEFINTKNNSSNKELNYVVEFDETNNVINTTIDEDEELDIDIGGDEDELDIDNDELDIDEDELDIDISDDDMDDEDEELDIDIGGDEDELDIDISDDDMDDEDELDIDIGGDEDELDIDEDELDIDVSDDDMDDEDEKLDIDININDNEDGDELESADEFLKHIKIDFTDFEKVIHELLDKQSAKINKNDNLNDDSNSDDNLNNDLNNNLLDNLDNFIITQSKQSKQFNNLKITNVQKAIMKLIELKSRITEIDSQCRNLIDEYLSNVNVVCFKTKNNQRILCKKNDEQTNYYFDKVIISVYDENE